MILRQKVCLDEISLKALFFDGSFFLKEFCKQFNIHFRIRSERPKTLLSVIKTLIDDKGWKILLAKQAQKW